MSRPRKCRKVCCMPGCNRFGPLDEVREPDDFVVMAVDEYETVRLIDLEDLTQEECAARMSVARTTVQSIYNNARRKLADSLVNGKVLQIEGGDYKLCDNPGSRCSKESCQRRKAMRGTAGE